MRNTVFRVYVAALIWVMSSVETTKNLDYLQCVYLMTDNSEQAECKWESSILCSNWTISYGLQDRPNKIYAPFLKYNCRNISHTKIICTQTVVSTRCNRNFNTICLDEYKSYVFRVAGRCANNSTVIGNFVLPTNETYIKIKISGGLTVTAKNDNAVNIAWKVNRPPFFFDSENITCQIQVRSLHGSNNVTTYTDQQDVLARVLNHLLPGTHYYFGVKCRPSRSVVWSDESTTETTTDYTVPLSGSSLISDGFVFWKNSLLVYFKVPSGFHAQGNITNIRLTLQRDGDEDRFTTEVQHVLTASLKLCWTTGLGGFKLDTLVKNQVGWRENATSVKFYPDADLPIPSYVIAEVNKSSGEFVISMEETITTDVNITYFWCIGTMDQSRIVTCQEDLQWITLSDKSYSGLIQRRTYLQWHFGVSISTGRNSSGIRWENCIFDQTDKDMSSKAPVVRSGRTFLVFIITRSFCTTNSYRPLNYIIELSQNDNRKNTTRVSATSFRNNVTINGLKPDTKYRIVYQTEYSYGTSPPLSFTAKTKSDGSPVHPSEVVIITVPFVCFLVIVALLIRFRKQIVKIRKILHYVPEIEIPPIPLTKVPDSGYTSEESGRCDKIKHDQDADSVIDSSINSNEPLLNVDYEYLKDNSFSPIDNPIDFTSQTNVKEVFEGNQSDSSARISISPVRNNEGTTGDYIDHNDLFNVMIEYTSVLPFQKENENNYHLTKRKLLINEEDEEYDNTVCSVDVHGETDDCEDDTKPKDFIELSTQLQHQEPVHDETYSHYDNTVCTTEDHSKTDDCKEETKPKDFIELTPQLQHHEPWHDETYSPESVISSYVHADDVDNRTTSNTETEANTTDTNNEKTVPVTSFSLYTGGDPVLKNTSSQSHIVESSSVSFCVCASHNKEQNNKELPYINDEIPIAEQNSVDVGFNIENNRDEEDSMESMSSYIHLNDANDTLELNVSDIEFTDSTNDSLNDTSNINQQHSAELDLPAERVDDENFIDDENGLSNLHYSRTGTVSRQDIETEHNNLDYVSATFS